MNENKRICQAIYRVNQDHSKYQLYSLECIARELAVEVQRLRTLKHISMWHEEDGCVLWWNVPVEEPPWVGSPLDSEWKEIGSGYEYWSPIPEPLEE